MSTREEQYQKLVAKYNPKACAQQEELKQKIKEKKQNREMERFLSSYVPYSEENK